MKILYLIGNGFDLNAGLKTSAWEFVRTLKESLEELSSEAESKSESIPEGLEALFKSIRNDIETWADFEIALGQFTAEIEGLPDPESAFMDAYTYLFDLFVEVVTKEDRRAQSFEITNEITECFARGATSLLEDVLSVKDKGILDSILKNETWEIGFATFNYTCLLDRLVESARQTSLGNRFGKTVQFMRPTHVHGLLSDEWGILVGVDNQEQIAGNVCQESEKIRNVLIKPLSNARAGMERDSQTSNIINAADVIAIFGMSLGMSDSKWWHVLAGWLDNKNAPNRRLVIAMRRPTFNPHRPWEMPDYQDSIKSLFFERAEVVDDEKRSYLSERIVVPLGSEAFNLPITFPDSAKDDSDE